MVRSYIARVLRGLRGQPKAAASGAPSSLAQFGPDHKVRHLSLIDSMICVLGRADLEKLIETRPLVAIRLLEIVGQRLVDAEAVIEDFAFKGVPARLATVLVRLAGRDGADEVRGYSHQDLAEMIGSYRETVTATLDDFKGRGLVTVGRRHIQILDRRGLERVAGI